MTSLQTLQECVRLAGELGGSLYLETSAAHQFMSTGDHPSWAALAAAADAALSYDPRGFVTLTSKQEVAK